MLKLTHDYKFWFVAGSQFLYGEEQLRNVARDAEDIVKKLNESGKLPYPIEFKGVMTTADGITQFMKDVNYNDDVAGVITWMHTFSPAKTGSVARSSCRNRCCTSRRSTSTRFRMTRLTSTT